MQQNRGCQNLQIASLFTMDRLHIAPNAGEVRQVVGTITSRQQGQKPACELTEGCKKISVHPPCCIPDQSSEAGFSLANRCFLLRLLSLCTAICRPERIILSPDGNADFFQRDESYWRSRQRRSIPQTA